MDYSEVQFRSYIYKYKEEQPRTSEIGIEKEFLEEIVYLLGKDIYTRQELEEIVYKTWLAMENPTSRISGLFSVLDGAHGLGQDRLTVGQGRNVANHHVVDRHQALLAVELLRGRDHTALQAGRQRDAKALDEWQP